MSEVAEPAATPGGPKRSRSRRRRLATAGLVVAIVAAIGVAVRVAPVDDAPLPVSGRPVLEFDLPSLDGATQVRARDLRGQPLVVNFWASWCAPCRREMPALVTVARRFQGRVAFVGVNNQDNREDAVEFAASVGLSYPSGFDPSGATARRTGLRGMPTTLFVDADGRILEQRTGEMSEATIVKTIDRLFPTEP